MIQKTPESPAVTARLAAHPLFPSAMRLCQLLRAQLPEAGGAVGLLSALPGEGVSTVALNLAVCAAETSTLPVLLLEAHTQASPLAHCLGAPSYPGLADVLQGRAAWDQVLQPTRVENLTLLSAGTAAGSAELDRAALSTAIAEIKRRFAFVVCDLAPAAAAHPSLAWAGLLDGVVLVLESGKVQAEAVKSAQHRLTQAEARLLGVVLNKREHQVPAWLEK